MKEIGGVDVNPHGFRMMIKYMKASAQTLTPAGDPGGGLLAPDVGFASFGTQTHSWSASFAGDRATKTALEAQARWGLRTSRIDPNHPEGPNKLRVGALVDSVLLRENPSEWFRKHIVGPGGVLERMGLDRAYGPNAASPARSPTRLRRCSPT